jgi:hypothetical protein
MPDIYYYTRERVQGFQGSRVQGQEKHGSGAGCGGSWREKDSGRAGMTKKNEPSKEKGRTLVCPYISRSVEG